MDSSRRRRSFSAYSKRTSPAGVSSTDLAERSRSLALYACSSWRIWALTADCERKTFWPAREKLFSLATKTKVVSWSKSIVRTPGGNYSESSRRTRSKYPSSLRPFLRVNRSLCNRRGNRRPQNRMTTLELGKNGAPSGLHGALKMNRLHANQRQCSAPREQASSARTGSKVNVFLKGAAQPIFFIGIEFGEGYEIAIEHVIGFSAQVMYSQPCWPTPSTTASAPLLRTAKRSPVRPAIKS